MAGWLSAFLLGRPGYEYTLSANPDSFDPTWERVGSDNRLLNGAIRERVLCTTVPTVVLKSNWFPKATDLDNIVSMLGITDTMLSFITRDDWHINLEPNIAPNTTTVQIQDTPISRLSAIYAAGSFGSTPTGGTITINGVWIAQTVTNGIPVGSGTNYYLGGSGGTYLDSTRTITLGTALSAATQVYVSYTFPGWLVRLKKVNAPIEGGRVDLFTCNYSLDGA
jgi:hypothetical protein